MELIFDLACPNRFKDDRADCPGFAGFAIAMFGCKFSTVLMSKKPVLKKVTK